VPTIDDLRRFAVTRSLFPRTTLAGAIDRFGFVQADPIRAPARAQDLILRHRVTSYRAGDLERQYPRLDVEEDFFVPYGFVTPALQALMHPRTTGLRPFSKKQTQEAALLQEFVRDRGEVHPREVNAHFARGRTRNYWGGQSNATTHLLSQMHYWGMLRIVRRDRGIRVYGVREQPPDAPASDVPRRIDAIVDLAVAIYAPIPASGLRRLVRSLRYAVPQWTEELTAALQRATDRLPRARVDGVDWYWPVCERIRRTAPPDRVRLLAPFDPVVADRERFEMLWGWTYRFEAYTPAHKRERGYYALPMLWRDRVVGWGTVAVKPQRLDAQFGYVGGRPPRERAFRVALDEELSRIREFCAATESRISFRSSRSAPGRRRQA
jgi:uncharacterized protein